MQGLTIDHQYFSGTRKHTCLTITALRLVKAETSPDAVLRVRLGTTTTRHLYYFFCTSKIGKILPRDFFWAVCDHCSLGFRFFYTLEKPFLPPVQLWGRFKSVRLIKAASVHWFFSRSYTPLAHWYVIFCSFPDRNSLAVMPEAIVV